MALPISHVISAVSSARRGGWFLGKLASKVDFDLWVHCQFLSLIRDQV
jgi:hypothetical protein